ncbi:hypothetical protein AQ490_13500 [Wenjunlia vitaminophila]|uniref:Uncharacterized protein n=1 Tax=Wenjunlia vitaminophila TaxID=76728 RepID=A0A0T6LXD4_WENVI|nr:hypothetical protein [Wenjunlia vitaminophila]KRV50782.1 hypothetical protein AQ490_13500 [Wenjunlia vitaminophila]
MQQLMFQDDQQFWFETLRNLGLVVYDGSDVGGQERGYHVLTFDGPGQPTPAGETALCAASVGHLGHRRLDSP